MHKRRMLAVVIICCCLLSSIAASFAEGDMPVQEFLSVDEMATRLSSIGFISGDAKGDFMLQSQLKRSDAAQFIVNLIGKNKYVKENKSTYSTTSFKDVKNTDWFAASVGFCEQSNIIGINASATYRPKDFTTEKEFLSMVIKALGYTSDDYTWSTVFQKAYEIKLVEDSDYQTKTEDNKAFKRADAVKIMYTALNLKPKAENMTLIQKLVNSDIISYGTAISSKILVDELASNIVEIRPLNEQKLKIVFNEKIGLIKPEDIQIYDTSDKSVLLSISIISQTDTELLIKTSQQVSRKKYTVEISKIVDLEGNTAPAVSANFAGYTATDVVSDLFKVSRVEQKDEDEVNVYFTHPVNENAVNSAYYEILENGTPFVAASSLETAINVLPDSEGINITLKGKKFTPEQEYSLKVSTDLMSAYGVNFVNQTDLDSFIAKELQSSVGFEVAQVTALSSKTIQVDFNMDIDQEIAQQIYMYKITDSDNKQIEILDAQMGVNAGKSIILTINGTLNATKTYNIMINYMTDATTQYKINKRNYSFSGYWSPSVDFNVQSVTPVDAGSVFVYFSKPLSEKSAIDATNYVLIDPKNISYSQQPKKVLFSTENPCIVKLLFSKDNKMQPDRSYTLRVMSKLTDYLGNTFSSQKDYNCDAHNVPSINMTVDRAAIISPDTIKVVFNREIALDAPNVLTKNYGIEYYDNGTLVKKIPIAITFIDNSTIVLKFDKLVDGIEYTFRYKEIKDLAGDVYSDQQINSIIVTKGK